MKKENSTEEAMLKTRSFSRVFGPFIAIVTVIITVKASSLSEILTSTFDNPVIVWILGAILLFGGIFIIAHHQIWTNFAAIVISLFGWFLGIRGIMMLAVPELIKGGGEAAIAPGKIIFVQIGFMLMFVLGVYLTYIGWRKKRNQ